MGERTRVACEGVLAAWLLLAAVPAAGQTAGVSSPRATVASDVGALPLSEIARRSDELAVYLKQLEERLAASDPAPAIEQELPAYGERIDHLLEHTRRVLLASPALRQVDDLLAQWDGLQDALSSWAERVTSALTVLDAELGGVARLRAIWDATRDAAAAAGAPQAPVERIRTARAAIQQTNKLLEGWRARLLILQDRVVQQAARCRDATEQLRAYRRAAVGRLLVPDSQPIWSPTRWDGDWEASLLAYRRQLAEGLATNREYIRLQLVRVPLQLALFTMLLFVLRRARRRTSGWLQEDDSLAAVAAVFDRPVSAALLLTLLSAPWFYPQMPILLRLAMRLAAIPPLLRVLGRLVDRPIVPGVYALGVFFALDQLRTVSAPLPAIEQGVFLVETAAEVAVLLWLVRSGRLARWRTAVPGRIVPFLERAAAGLVVVLAVAVLAAALGFMQLARVITGAVLGSGYAAMLLFAVQRVGQGVWAYLLRTRVLRGVRIVRQHRALLQHRGERVLSWTAGGVWLVATLAVLELLQPARAALYAVLTATFTVGAFSISAGDVLALVLAIAAAFLFSRFLRFVLEEEVYPRVALPRGLPFALSQIAHYAVLVVGLLIGLAAAGLQLDRFALLAGAFGVGIGFGLQNVVNNFVSGLILLFERPLRVGDTIQIGAICGEIRRVGIRSSTVRTFEGAEVIVPNATLIADSVTNWTLTDRMRRIDLPVAVAYGSDPEQVLEVLRVVAAAHPLVVAAPAPSAIFMGFGEAALNFELRAWTDRFERWMNVRSDLAIAVLKALTAAGIAVPVIPRERYRGDTPGG